jgi:serine/threonine protein kinase
VNTTSDTAPSLLGDRYLLCEQIGRGGTAVVHRAWDRMLDRDVAVKMLDGQAMGGSARARFEDEGQTLARLSHPGLITLFDTGLDQGRPYLVMELVRGQTLTARCRQDALAADEVTRIGTALAETLAYVHASGIVHRDVKPSNVLLGDDGRVRLADFGIARLLGSTVRHTDTGVTLGTATYLAPEQVRGEAVSSACDVYALGLVLLEALTGRPAYSGSLHEVALARLTSPPLIARDLPAHLRSLLRAVTATDPRARPTAEQVATALRAGARPVPRPRTRLVSAIALAAATAATAATLIVASPLVGTSQADGRTPPTAGVSTAVGTGVSPATAQQLHGSRISARSLTSSSSSRP